MSPRNVTNIDESQIGALGRSMRKLWNGNDWKLSDEEFEVWRKHLHRGRYTFRDLEDAVFEYVHGGGIYKPRFGDLKTLLRRCRQKRTGEVNNVEELTTITPQGQEQIEVIKGMLEGGPVLSREETIRLYDAMTGRT